MQKRILSKTSVIFIIVLAVLLLLIFFNWRGWLKAPQDAATWIFSPVLRSFHWAAGQLAGGLNFLTTLKNIVAENYDLKQENQKLWQENTTFKEADRENQVLRERLNLGPVQNHRFVLASIIGYVSEPGQYFLIDKGTADGVAPNQAAVTAENFLVGRVTETSNHGAKVLLVSDGNSLINALTQDSRASGIVKGSHGVALTMEMMPTDKKIQIGETVLTSGRDDGLPADLIIGKVTQVVSKESGIFQQATLEPAINFKDLESVFVIK